MEEIIQKAIDTLYEEDVYVTQERWDKVILPLIKELEGLVAVEHRLAADEATEWRWADKPCPKCHHVHRAYGADVKHCPICGVDCKHYGAASLGYWGRPAAKA